MQTSNSRARTQGFTLVEVLVSLVILSMGLLGIAKLVLYSSHANDSAYLRSQATELAYAILDNMRANRQQALVQAYDVAVNTVPGSHGACVGAQCSPAALALDDRNSWLARVNVALPSGTASVTTIPVAGTPTVTAGVTAVIKVQWDDAAAEAVFGGKPQNVSQWMNVTLETVL
ncbi:MAG: type IV pilus modification protein PilV [Pseudomonadota bacterium]|nr:type IV pilus modification protein PilV [Pseudomonadota bacterium]